MLGISRFFDIVGDSLAGAWSSALVLARVVCGFLSRIVIAAPRFGSYNRILVRWRFGGALDRVLGQIAICFPCRWLAAVCVPLGTDGRTSVLCSIGCGVLTPDAVTCDS